MTIRHRPNPAVSVVISTYNSQQWIIQALAALAAQTLSESELEVIVVDDGSTDDTWAVLERAASLRSNVHPLRQPHTGGPSTGRNLGLRHASGTFVFFHDADDFLALDGLSRLLTSARRNQSDVVAGQVHWLTQQRRDRKLKTADHAGLLTSGLWRSLTLHKLIRRQLIDRLGLSFREDLVQGEDQVFMATCLIAARGAISTVGGRPVYYRRIAADDANLSRRPQSLANKALTCCRMVELVVANTRPGRRRKGRLAARWLLTVLTGPASLAILLQGVCAGLFLVPLGLMALVGRTWPIPLWINVKSVSVIRR